MLFFMVNYFKKHWSFFVENFGNRNLFFYFCNALLERWESGLIHRFAKPACGETCTGGSNPPLSAEMVEEMETFFQLFCFQGFALFFRLQNFSIFFGKMFRMCFILKMNILLIILINKSPTFSARVIIFMLCIVRSCNLAKGNFTQRSE
jgi:hypothetical protein